jgi:two-component system LytT family response regulator
MNQRLSAIIIDDESKARNLLKGILNEFFDFVEVLADCENLVEGVKAIKKHKPNLVFLDIEMPNYSGLEILDFFGEDEIDFHIVFVTAYNQYAIQALKLSAIDYLLKPIEIDELEETINRVLKRVEKQNLTILKDNFTTDKPKKLVVSMSNSIKFLNLEDILFLKGEGAYTNIYQKDDLPMLCSRNLKFFENALSDYTQFFRCHKSYIVNINYVKDLNKTDGLYIKIKNFDILVSQDKLPQLLNLIGTGL